MNFTETPESTSAAIGSSTTLRCATNGRAERCAWNWRPLDSASSEVEGITRREFPSDGDLGRNCSLTLDELTSEQQGYWSCRVYLAGVSSDMSTAPAKLTVYEEGICIFFGLLGMWGWLDSWWLVGCGSLVGGELCFPRGFPIGYDVKIRLKLPHIRFRVGSHVVSFVESHVDIFTEVGMKIAL